jgi:hypothetical protein
MLKLISGALIRCVNYKEIYMDSDIYDKTNPPITTNNMGVDQNSNIHKYQPCLKQLESGQTREEKT